MEAISPEPPANENDARQGCPGRAERAWAGVPNVTPRSLYLGRFTEDGYAELWSSKESMDGGNMWRTLATGSHPVESVQ